MLFRLVDGTTSVPIWRAVGLDSFWTVEVDERRPSFPQGGLNWRLRQEKRPKKNSVCEREQISNGPDKEEVDGKALFPESLPPDYFSRPMIRINDGLSETEATRILLRSGEDQTTTTSSASRHESQCSCSGCPASISFPSSNGRGLYPSGGRGGSFPIESGQWRSSKETVIINVGGHIFETYRSTLKRLKSPIFDCEVMFKLYFRKTHGDYFFDRDPTAFGSVLNFLRTGELHIPTNMCGPALQNELEFWGMDELDISRCCWTQYNTWKTQCRSLEKLENDRKFSTTQHFSNVRSDSSTWVKVKSSILTYLQDPGSSRWAKMYAWVSIIFVFISIFSFCAETHPMFKVKARDMTAFSSFYQFFNFESIPWDVVLNQTMTSSLSEHENRTLGGTSYKGGGNDAKTITNNDIHNHNDDDYYANEEIDDGKIDWGDKDLPHPVLLMMDVSCLIFFSLEYLTRFLCSPNKMDFVRALQNIVDFLAFAPDYIELLFLLFDTGENEGANIMEMFFILRILRLFRIFRLIRHVPGLWILLYTLKASFNELLLMCVFLIIGMVVFATLIHFVEPDGGFNNIPVGFWWSVVTMTTVGYGDMHPQSALGYVIGSCCAVAGLLMIAFTVPIIVSNFVLYYTHVQYGLARKDREIDRLILDEEEGQEGMGRTNGALHEEENETKKEGEEEEEEEKEEEDGEEEIGEDFGITDLEQGRIKDNESKSRIGRKGKKKAKKKFGGGRINAKDSIESNNWKNFEEKRGGADREAPSLVTTRNGNSYFGVRDSDAIEMREHSMEL